MSESFAKPHYGRIQDWRKVECTRKGLGYIVVGHFLDHPEFAGCKNAHTSYVIKHDEESGEIETRNSRYTLVLPSVETTEGS